MTLLTLLTATTNEDPAYMLIIFYLMAIGGVIGSGLCSGLETGFYTLNRIRLHVRAQTGDQGACIIDRMLHNPNRLLATLLISNNMCNFCASYGIAAILTTFGFSHWQEIAINVSILTPALFIFAEVLPKDFFANFTDLITYYFARPVSWFQKLLTVIGLLPLVDGAGRAIARLLKSDHLPRTMVSPRNMVAHLAKEGAGHGVISAYQSDIIARVLDRRHVTVEDVMVPWNEVITFREGRSFEEFCHIADRVPFTRLPIMGRNGKPFGILNVFDVLAHNPDRCPPLESLARPATPLTPEVHCRQALAKLQAAKSRIGIVLNEHDQPVGLITVKDLLEPMLGELNIW